MRTPCSLWPGSTGPHRAEDPSAEDGLYTLTLDTDGNLTVGGFSGDELEG
jgi:hypothetical protein